MYRLDVFSRWVGWVTMAVGHSRHDLMEMGMDYLPPRGKAVCFRVRKARKRDLRSIDDGLFVEHPTKDMYIDAGHAADIRMRMQGEVV